MKGRHEDVRNLSKANIPSSRSNSFLECVEQFKIDYALNAFNGFERLANSIEPKTDSSKYKKITSKKAVSKIYHILRQLLPRFIIKYFKTKFSIIHLSSCNDLRKSRHLLIYRPSLFVRKF